MKDITNFIKQNADGSYTIDNDAYSKELQSELDRARQQASDTARQNAEKELRSSIMKELQEKAEADAKLTAEQKLQAEREAFAKEKRDFDILRVKNIYKEAGFTEKEIEYLAELVGDDTEKNLEKATNIAEARKVANEETRKKIQEELQTNGRRGGDDNGGGSGEKGLGARMAEKFSQATVNDYVDLSGNSSNKQ